ncbi:MAG: hypothetical protein NVS1B7_7240 [Candidatus Saccharimonadales bacterium]
MRWKSKKIFTLGLIIIMLVATSPAVVTFAQTFSSPNYSANEVQFGAGSGSGTSTNYQATVGVGSTGVGTSSSTNYRSNAGFITPNQPYLEMQVNPVTIDFGVLTSTTTATGTGTFSVRSYLSGSYAVYTMSNPPTNEAGAILKPITVAAASAVGTEQFGINLVANTLPIAFGTNPTNVPDNTYADGQAAAGYNTPNTYQYNAGDIIARSPKTTGNQAAGETDYTISYIANIAYLTKAGLYVMNHDIVALATY